MKVQKRTLAYTSARPHRVETSSTITKGSRVLKGINKLSLSLYKFPCFYN